MHISIIDLGLFSFSIVDISPYYSIKRITSGANRQRKFSAKTQVDAMNRLDSAIRENVAESKNITDAVTRFEKSSSRMERVMILLASASLIASIVQIIVAFFT